MLWDPFDAYSAALRARALRRLRQLDTRALELYLVPRLPIETHGMTRQCPRARGGGMLMAVGCSWRRWRRGARGGWVLVAVECSWRWGARVIYVLAQLAASVRTLLHAGFLRADPPGLPTARSQIQTKRMPQLRKLLRHQYPEEYAES